MSTKVKLIICIAFSILGIPLMQYFISLSDAAENEAIENYDYSNISSYEGTVLKTEYEHRHSSNSGSKYVYILLDNGKEISIGIGGASGPENGERVTVYSPDETNYEFSERAVAMGYSGFGTSLMACFIPFILVFIWAMFFCGKGAAIALAIVFFIYFPLVLH